MDTLAVVLSEPEKLSLRRLELTPPTDEDVVVDIDWSGISTGTEKLLWTGRMPPFPGLGYPLVPGYESVGRVSFAGARSGRAVGDYVFVPGAKCYGEVHGLFGGAAARVVVPGSRVIPFKEELAEHGVLIALAATAYHALAGGELPELIVGHGVLGRLLARLAVIEGGNPVVWEVNPQRMDGAQGYAVIDPASDVRKDYRSICDVSGDPALLDTLIGRLGRGGEIVLAGFYDKPLSFNFPPAFMREARLRIAAEFKDPDLAKVKAYAESGQLALDGLITHRLPASEAQLAYRTAFGDASCLKMVIDWRDSHGDLA
ncbi:chlorophyll synthesis pathway protein BchC [Rhodocyclus purpureus]|uniref:chlorophyll synthesis pathway protein BchC n=1 Tax=Rhodocyclus purpureus TaxID=1067 RepID=UPI001911BCC5|nr:chlorophyll synthesis pathway protein BchC [Rhodocyclus purpureus]MBK5912767.1 chlorophyll synthesis pathway protein BchC [Rhodocyclus purpureus]